MLLRTLLSLIFDNIQHLLNKLNFSLISVRRKQKTIILVKRNCLVFFIFLFVSVGATFQIDSCENIEEDLWDIKLHATDRSNALADEYIEYRKKKMIQSNILLSLGNLFLEMGEYDKAERYFDTILYSANPN